MKIIRWAVWSNGAQMFDKKSYFFYSSAVRRRNKIMKSQAYNLGVPNNLKEIPGYIQMDLVVTVR